MGKPETASLTSGNEDRAHPAGIQQTLAMGVCFRPEQALLFGLRQAYHMVQRLN